MSSSFASIEHADIICSIFYQNIIIFTIILYAVWLRSLKKSVCSPFDFLLKLSVLNYLKTKQNKMICNF